MEDKNERPALFIPRGKTDANIAVLPEAPVALGKGHQVSAIYPSPEEAEAVSESLKKNGFSAKAISILKSAPVASDGPADKPDGSDDVLKDILIDGAIGTAVGTGVGALGTVALMAADVTLFVASPVVATLAMVGWFAGLGGLIGAMVGTDESMRKEGKLIDLVKDAIAAGNTVLIVRTIDPAETELAKELIHGSLLGRDQDAMSSQ